MGMWLANMKGVDVRQILHFKENLSVLLISGLFILLAARLEERESAYASCFRALLQIAGAEPHQAVADLREQVAALTTENQALRAQVAQLQAQLAV